MSEADRPRERKVGKEHPTELALSRFLRGELSPSESAAVVRHLLTRCPRCARITAGLWRLGDPAPGRMTGGGADPVRLSEVRLDG
jgi:anti-sigma factor RsiW